MLFGAYGTPGRLIVDDSAAWSASGSPDVIAGDASYTEALMLAGQIDGASAHDATNWRRCAC